MGRTLRLLRMNEWFRRISSRSAEAIGSSWAFVLAVLLILLWGISGPLFGFSDTWQLVINTTSSLVTFLAVFLIQNTQNRDAKAIHLKLDELLKAVEGARTRLVNIEERPEEEIKELVEEFRALESEHEHDPDVVPATPGQHGNSSRTADGGTAAEQTQR